jgi:hypothetical protein
MTTLSPFESQIPGWLVVPVGSTALAFDSEIRINATVLAEVILYWFDGEVPVTSLFTAVLAVVVTTTKVFPVAWKAMLFAMIDPYLPLPGLEVGDFLVLPEPE